MKEVLVKYLKANVDDGIRISKLLNQSSMPLILLEKYKFYEIYILENKCILIEESSISSGIAEMKKHMSLIMKKQNSNVIFLFKNISKYKRKSMIKERIPFIIESGQMYLPFLGFDLSNETKQNSTVTSYFSPAAQLLYLYFLYNENLELNATELAAEMNISRMHAVRALNSLYELDLLTYYIGGKTGRSKYYKRILDTEYYQIGKAFLKSPIQKLVYVDYLDSEYPEAGLNLLSKISMINPSTREIRAISKIESRKYSEKFTSDIDEIKNEKLIEVQLWDYDPMFLAKNGGVDILSLVLSLKNTNDERVEKAIDELLKGEKWYTE